MLLLLERAASKKGNFCARGRGHYLEIYARRFWVKELNPKIQEIRRTLLDKKTTTRKQTSFINTVKGRLAWEYPARTTVQSQRGNGFLQTRQPPAFWAWLAGRGQDGKKHSDSLRQSPPLTGANLVELEYQNSRASQAAVLM
jgi:hypothetical protein